MRKLSVCINALIGLFVYIAIYAVLHHGFGPGGHIGDENDVAIALNTVIPIAFLSLLFAENLRQKVLFGGAFGLLVAGVIATMSRGGFIGLVAVSLYCFVLTPQKMKAIGVGLVLLVGVAAMAPDSYWDEIASIGAEAQNEDPNAGTGALRRVYWSIARDMFYANPIFGVGLGNFGHNIGIYQSAELHEQVERDFSGQRAHSLYFTILAELGISGFLIFGAILWYNLQDISTILKGVMPVQQRYARGSPGHSSISKSSLPISNRGNKMSQWRPAPSYVGRTISPISDTGYQRDLQLITFYAHGVRAGMLGYLVSGVFLSVFTYPHFWILTALTVTLKIMWSEQCRRATDSLRSPQVA